MTEANRKATPSQEEVRVKIERLLDSLNRVLLDKKPLIADLVTGILAGGHVLLEGLPGLGKTELVKGLSRLCGVRYGRIQFTPDLLPGDVTGTYLLQEKDGHRDFEFQKGPVFTNILLADEINRASPKTQSALLEAMQEHSVTVMGSTHALPDPFFVIATQNPIEMEGTYPLPEAQVDRFLFKLHVDRPGTSALEEIIRNRVNGAPPSQEAALDLDDLREAIITARDVYISEAVAAYMARLVEASHPDSPLAPDMVKKYVKYGASPRAAIALAAACRARALILGRPQAGFDTAREMFGAVMNHRIILDYSARMDGVEARAILAEILSGVDEYSKPLPPGVRA